MTDEERQHAEAVDTAQAHSDLMLGLFALIGSADYPRGRIISAYRVARQALSQDELLQREAYVRSVLENLADAVSGAMALIIAQAFDDGVKIATDQARIWRLPDVRPEAADAGRQNYASAAAQVVGGVVAAQIASVASDVLTGRATALRVVGDSARLGVLNPFPAITQARDVVVKASTDAFTGAITPATGGRVVYGRQAVAAIDERTTDCCLRVHGQVVPLDGQFTLTGTPRYADQLPAPPFHWNCRTAIALVPVGMADDALSQRMRAAAAREIDERERTKTRVEINPANALSGRG